MSKLSIEKYFHDFLYGRVGLTYIEKKIVDSKAFQRLRNIGQLGMASLVYPGATYSRFSHGTPITDDVIGWLEWEDVEKLLGRIAELPGRVAVIKGQGGARLPVLRRLRGKYSAPNPISSGHS